MAQKEKTAEAGATPEGGDLVTASVTRERPRRRRAKAGRHRTVRSAAPVQPLSTKGQEALDLLLHKGGEHKGRATVRFPTSVLRQAFPKDALARWGELLRNGHVRIGKRIQGKANKWGHEVTVFRAAHPSLVIRRSSDEVARRRAATREGRELLRRELQRAKAEGAKRAAKAMLDAPVTTAKRRVRIEFKESAQLRSHLAVITKARQQLAKVREIEELIRSRENAVRLLGFRVEYAEDGTPRLTLPRKEM